MPRMSAAKLRGPSAFPQRLGEPLWQERRTLPVELLAGVPVAFLATATVTVGSFGLRVLLAAATVAGVVVLLRLRRRGLLETYTVTDAGVLTLGFVRRQKSLARTLERVAPAVQVMRRIDLSCPT